MKRNPHQFLAGLKVRHPLRRSSGTRVFILGHLQIYIVPLGSLSPATWRSKILIKRAREAGADFIDQRGHDDGDVIYLACTETYASTNVKSDELR